MFKVQSKMCATCIYRPDSSLDLKKLEDDVRDKHVGFKGHRTCHHSDDVCCRGFWNAHKNEFPMGQVAQRLGFVEFVNVDTLKDATERAKRRRADGLKDRRQHKDRTRSGVAGSGAPMRRRRGRTR